MTALPSSNLALAAAVIGGMAILGQAGHWAFKTLRPRQADGRELEVASQFISVLATLNSLLLAFMAVSIWDGYKAADSAALNEATAVAMLSRDLGSYKGTQQAKAAAARVDLRAYADCAIQDEWPLLAEGKSHPPCLDALNRVFLAVAEIEPKSIRGQVILGEIWTRINELARHRRERLQASRAAVPGVLWFVVLIGTALTIGASFLLPRTAFGKTMILMLSVSYGAVFFFIVAMEKPFRGPERIRPDALERVRRNMGRFDAIVEAERGR